MEVSIHKVLTINDRSETFMQSDKNMQNFEACNKNQTKYLQKNQMHETSSFPLLAMFYDSALTKMT